MSLMEQRKTSKKRSIFTSNFHENTLTVKVKRTQSESRIEVAKTRKCYDLILKNRKSKSIPRLVEKSFRNRRYSVGRRKQSHKLLPSRNESQSNMSNKIEESENVDSPSPFAKPPIQTRITLSTKAIKVSPESESQPNIEVLKDEPTASSKEYKYHLFGKDNVNINLAMKFKGVPSSLLASLNPNKEMECKIRYNTDNDAESLRDLNENLDILNKTIKKSNKLDSILFENIDVTDKQILSELEVQPITEALVVEKAEKDPLRNDFPNDKKLVAKPRLSLIKTEVYKDKSLIKESKPSIIIGEASVADKSLEEPRLSLIKSEIPTDKQPFVEKRLSIMKAEIPIDSQTSEIKRLSIIKTELPADNQHIDEAKLSVIDTEIPTDKHLIDEQKLTIIKTETPTDKQPFVEKRVSIMKAEMPIDSQAFETKRLSIIKTEIPTDRQPIDEKSLTVISTEMPTDKHLIDEKMPFIIETEIPTDRQPIEEKSLTVISSEISMDKHPIDEQKFSIIKTEIPVDIQPIDEQKFSIIKTEIPMDKHPIDEQKFSIIKTEIPVDIQPIDEQKFSIIKTEIPVDIQPIDGQSSIKRSEMPSGIQSIDRQRKPIINIEIPTDKQREMLPILSIEMPTSKHSSNEQRLSILKTELPSNRQPNNEPRTSFLKSKFFNDLPEGQKSILTNQTFKTLQPDIEPKQLKTEPFVKRLSVRDIKYKTIEIGKISKITPINEEYALESTITSIKIKEYFSESSVSNVSSESNYGVADSSEQSTEMVPRKEKINYTLFATITPIASSIGKDNSPRFVIEEPSFICESPSLLKIDPGSFKYKPVEIVTPKLDSIMILPVSLISQSELTQIMSDNLTETDSKLSSQNYYEAISGSSKTKSSLEMPSREPLDHIDVIPVISSSINQYTISNESSQCEPLSKFEQLRDQTQDESESTDDRDSPETRFPEHESRLNLFEIEHSKRKGELTKGYVLESNRTSFNIKEYQDSSSSSDNSSQFINTIDNFDHGFSKTNQIHILNANVYQNVNPDKDQLDKRKTSKKKAVETAPAIVSAEGSIQSNNDARNALSVKDQNNLAKERKNSEKIQQKNKESTILDNSKLTTNPQLKGHTKRTDQSKDVSISEKIYSIVPGEKIDKDNEKTSDLHVRTVVTVKTTLPGRSVKNLKPNEFDKEKTSSASSFEAVDKQYLMHEKLADEKPVGYFIKQSEVSVIVEEPYALSTAISYRETEFNKNLQFYLDQDLNKTKLIPDRTIDTQYLKHANILKDTYKTVNREMYIQQSLSKLVKPVSSQCKYTITEEDIKRIIESMGNMPGHSKSAYKDITNIFKELKLTDDLLQKFMLNVEEIHGKTMSQIDLKDLERYLEQTSPSYREWKRLNDPSDFTKDRFLLNLVSVIHKTQNYPCAESLDKQYSSHFKLNEDGYATNELDILKDAGLLNLSQSSKDAIYGECPLNDIDFDELNMKRGKINQTSHSDPSAAYKSKLYNLETDKIRSLEDSKRGIGIDSTSRETSELKVKAMLDDARNNKSQEINYATFFFELLNTLNSTDIKVTEELLDEIDANLQLLREKGLTALSMMELERIAKYINFINTQWKDSKVSSSLSGKKFCESLQLHIRDSKSGMRSSTTKTSSPKTKSVSVNKVNEMNKIVGQHEKSRTNNDSTDQMKTINEENLKITNVPRIDHIFDANSTANMEASESLAVETLIRNSKGNKYLNYREFFIELAKLLESYDVPVTIENLKQTLGSLQSIKNSKDLSKIRNNDLEDIARFINVIKETWKDMLKPKFKTNENFLDGLSSHMQLMITDLISKSYILDRSNIPDDLCNRRFMKTPHEIPKNRLNASSLNTSFSQESEQPERTTDKIVPELDIDKKKDPTVSIEKRELYKAAEGAKIEVNEPPVLDNQTFSLDVENIITRARQSNDLNYASFFAELIKVLGRSGLNITEELLNQLKSDIGNLKKKGLESLYNKELERLAEFIDASKGYLKDFQKPHLYSNENFIKDLLSFIDTKIKTMKPDKSSSVDKRYPVLDIHEAVTTIENGRDRNSTVNQDEIKMNATTGEPFTKRISNKYHTKNQNQPYKSLDQLKTPNQVNYEEFFSALSKQLSPLKLNLTNELLDQLLLDLDLLSRTDVSSLPEKEWENLAGYLDMPNVRSKITNSLSNEEFIKRLTSDINERKFQLSTNTTRSNLIKSEKDKTNSPQPKDVNYAVYFTELSKKLPILRQSLTKEVLNQIKSDLGLLKTNGISSLPNEALEKIADLVEKLKDQLKGLSNPSQYSNRKFIDDLISETSHLLCSSITSPPNNSQDTVVNQSKDSKARNTALEHEQRKSQPARLSDRPNQKDHMIHKNSKESFTDKRQSIRNSKNGQVEVGNYTTKDLTLVPSIRLENIHSEVVPEAHNLFPVKTDTPTTTENQLIDSQTTVQQNPRISVENATESINKTFDKFDDHTTNISIVDESIRRIDGETVPIVNSALSQNHLSTSSINKIKPLIIPETSDVITQEELTNDTNTETLLLQLPEKLAVLKDDSESIKKLEISDKQVLHSVKSLENKNVFLPTTSAIEILTEYSNIPKNKSQDLMESLIRIKSETESNHLNPNATESPKQNPLTSPDQTSEHLRIQSQSSLREKSNKKNIEETLAEGHPRDSVRIRVSATQQNLLNVPSTNDALNNEGDYSKEIDKLEEVVILTEIETQTVPITLQTVSITITDIQRIKEEDKINQTPLDYKDSKIGKRNQNELDTKDTGNVINKDFTPSGGENEVGSSDIKEPKRVDSNVEKDEAINDQTEPKSKTDERFDENSFDIILKDIFEFLINSSLDDMFSRKPAGDDFSKCNRSLSSSCDMSEKTDCLGQSPIIDYKTNICFNSKVPIQIAHHEEHSHVKIRKCPNNKNKYRLSNTTFRKTEMILPKNKRKLSSGSKPAGDKIVEKAQSDLYKETVENVINNLDRHVDASPKISSTTSPIASIISSSDYEYKIPVIIPKEEKPESIVQFNSTGKWQKLSKHNCDGIQPPSGYYKKGNNYLPYSGLYLKQSKSNSYLATREEFQIPADGIFGRDLEEPKFTNFCCNTCRSWISLGDRQQHLKECMEKNRFSETMRPKLDPRTIKRMPGVVCYVCGNRYTKHSINIHEKSCLSKWIQQNNSLKRQLRKQFPVKPALNEAEIRTLIQDQQAQGRLDYCAEDAVNDIYFLYSRNHLIELNE